MTTFNALHLNAFIAGYLEAIIFAECATDQHGEEIENLAGYEFSLVAQEFCKQECARFLDTFGGLVNLAVQSESVDYDHTQAGRDLWFTRQGHGVGFWDRGLGAIGDHLTTASKTFGERYIFINDDGLIEVE